jgi:hypothetical protein
LEVIGIPMSVKVNLSSTSLSGKEISSADSCGIQKVAKDEFIVEVPFHGKQETVQVHLEKAAGTPEYMNFRLPEVRNISLNKGMLHVEASMPVRLAIFAVPSGCGFENIKIIARSNDTSDIHNVNLTEKSAINLQNSDIYVGAISQQKQSILYGPVR